jgi:tetratricopeptide (TPR) repeat protein
MIMIPLKHTATVLPLYFAIALLILVATAATAQTAEMDSLMYQAYVESKDYDKAVSMWKKVIEGREQLLNKDPGNSQLRYELVLAQFGLLTATMRKKDEGLFDAYAEAAEKNLERLINDNKKRAEPRAVLGSVYGLRLAYSPWKGMYLGPKSSGLMEEALERNANVALVQKLYGNSKFFTPETFGGDVNAAIASYEKAIGLYEKNNQTKNNWFYLDTIVFLGQAYSKAGNHAEAIAAYEKVLSIEPEYGWVKHSLLPEERKHQ